MAALGAVGAPAATSVATAEAQITQRRSIGRQLVRGDGLRDHAGVLQKLAMRAKRSLLVAPGLDRHVQHYALVVHRPPEPTLPSTDLDHHLVVVLTDSGWKHVSAINPG